MPDSRSNVRFVFSCCRSALGNPILEEFGGDLTEDIGVDNCTSSAVDDARGRVASAGDLLGDCFGVTAKRHGNPGHVSHGSVEAGLVSVARDNDDLEVFGAARIPLIVEFLQVLLEGLAARSPVSGVQNHDDLVAINSLTAMRFARGINKRGSEEVSHIFCFINY